MRDLRGLKVWEKSHRLALAAYKVTAAFLRDELYGWTNQIRRSCVSVSANIAEGCGRYGDVQLARFLQIAAGSTSEELEYHLLFAYDLNLLSTIDYAILSKEVTEVKRMLASLIKRLKADNQWLRA
jgi:four helix bundle protein